MHYFIIAGEASGDQHGANLMQALIRKDERALFTFAGGERMRQTARQAVQATCITRSEDLAYMGIIDVVRHYPEIRREGKKIQRQLLQHKPDVVICIDYPGFNFEYILPFVKQHLPQTKVVYYIPPKVWAWRKGRVRALRNLTDLVLCIFPFEVDFFAQNNVPQARYIGNPSLDVVRSYVPKEETPQTKGNIAILSGSRRSEIKDNLPLMLKVAKAEKLRPIIAAAPGLTRADYDPHLKAYPEAELRWGDTYGVLKEGELALVTSGTATLETALLGVPQVVCYKVAGGPLPNFIFKHFFGVPFISLVNLVAGREVVQELYGHRFRFETIRRECQRLRHEDAYTRTMVDGYKEVYHKLYTEHRAADNAATQIIALINNK